VLGILREARNRSAKKLVAERLGKETGKIPMGRRFWPLTGEERGAVGKLIATAKVNKLVTSLVSRPNDAGVELLDAAYWVKGCSSLGLWRAAALVRVGGRRGGALALIDIKEATAPLSPRSARARMPPHQGERVVAGARALSPGLGDRMASASVLERPVFVRELMPQDLKCAVESRGADEARTIGHYLAVVVATAHARQLDPDAAGAWLETFRKENAKNMTAPAWLWAAVVDLVALHEGAYLEHCREHALIPSAAAAAAVVATNRIVSHHVTGD
jgi:uncharacterized protein (DUF2252 family)